MTRDEMRRHIEEVPLPNTEGASRPWEVDDGDTGYDLAGRGLAHAFLVLCEEDPSLLEVPSRADDPTGSKGASNDKLWQAFKKRWPDGDDWLGGTTGFQFGWAHNAVRYVLDAGPVGNPAIVTIRDAMTPKRSSKAMSLTTHEAMNHLFPRQVWKALQRVARDAEKKKAKP